MEISEEQAKKMKTVMTPRVMSGLVRWGGRARKVMTVAKQTKDRLFGTQLRAAITVLIIALIIAHLFGYF